MCLVYNVCDMSQTPPVSKPVLWSALLIQQSLGGLTFPIARYGLSFIDPFVFAFYRFSFSAMILLFIVRLQKHRQPIEKRDFFKILGLGVLIIPFNQTAYLVGQRLTAASHGALLFATVPLWLFVTALIHLKEKFVLRRGIGVALGLTGVLVIISGGAIEISRTYLWGDLIILEAVLAWVYYTIIGKPLVVKYGAFRVTAYSLSFGSALYFPFGFYRAWIFDYSAVPPTAWLTVAYVALGVSVAAYVLWYWLLKHLETTRLAVFNNIQPVIASVVAMIFLGEPLGISLVTGGAIVLTGVIITEISGKRKNP